MVAGADLLKPDTWQSEDDLSLRHTAQQAIGPRIRRGDMTAHGEAVGRRSEGLALLLDRSARAPPPGTMNEGSVRRVHQPDDGMVDRRGEADVLDEIGRSFVEPVEQRNLRRCGRILAKKHPQVSLHLAHRVVTRTDARWGEALARHERRDRGALPVGVEAPAVIAALDFASIEAAGAERHPAMGARVVQ